MNGLRKLINDNLNIKNLSSKVNDHLLEVGYSKNLSDHYKSSLEYWTSAQSMMKYDFDSEISDLLLNKLSFTEDEYFNKVDYVEEVVADLIARELDFEDIDRQVTIELKDKEEFID